MSAETPSPVVRFAAFAVHPEIGELRKCGHHIKLQDKPFQILVTLLERPGGLVSREELYKRLWSDDTFVDFDHNLNNAVDKLRKALNDSAKQPKFIETVPRRGYRFIATVERYSLPVVSNVGEAARFDSTVAAELQSASAPAPNVNQRPAPVSSKRKQMVALAVVASLLLVALLVSLRFFRLPRLLATSPDHGNGEITSLVIEKEGALNPLYEGFKVSSIGHFEADVMRNSRNDGYDRWRVVSEDQMHYYRTLTPTEKQFAANRDWKLTCVCAVESGGMNVNIDLGKRRFDIELIQEENKYYVALWKKVSPEFEWEEKVEFPGANDIDHPHTYELHYDHAAQTASLWIDGRLMASGYHGHTQFVENLGLVLGSFSYRSAKLGIGVFRSVRFEVH